MRLTPSVILLLVVSAAQILECSAMPKKVIIFRMYMRQLWAKFKQFLAHQRMEWRQHFSKHGAHGGGAMGHGQQNQEYQTEEYGQHGGENVNAEEQARAEEYAARMANQGNQWNQGAKHQPQTSNYVSLQDVDKNQFADHHQNRPKTSHGRNQFQKPDQHEYTNEYRSPSPSPGRHQHSSNHQQQQQEEFYGEDQSNENGQVPEHNGQEHQGNMTPQTPSKQSKMSKVKKFIPAWRPKVKMPGMFRKGESNSPGHEGKQKNWQFWKRNGRSKSNGGQTGQEGQQTHTE